MAVSLCFFGVVVERSFRVASWCASKSPVERTKNLKMKLISVIDADTAYKISRVDEYSVNQSSQGVAPPSPKVIFVTLGPTCLN